MMEYKVTGKLPENPYTERQAEQDHIIAFSPFGGNTDMIFSLNFQLYQTLANLCENTDLGGTGESESEIVSRIVGTIQDLGKSLKCTFTNSEIIKISEIIYQYQNSNTPLLHIMKLLEIIYKEPFCGNSAFDMQHKIIHDIEDYNVFIFYPERMDLDINRIAESGLTEITLDIPPYGPTEKFKVILDFTKDKDTINEQVTKFIYNYLATEMPDYVGGSITVEQVK